MPGNTTSRITRVGATLAPLAWNRGFESTSLQPNSSAIALQEGGDVDQVCREDRVSHRGSHASSAAAAAARWASLFILFRSSRAFGRYLILGRSNREIGRSLLLSFFLPLHRADGVFGLGVPVFPVP